LTEVSKAVRDRLSEHDVPIGRAAINFIIKGIHWGGHRYDPDLSQDPKALATAFVRNLRTLVQPGPPLEGTDLDEALSFCSGMLLSPGEVAQVAAGNVLVDRGAPGDETARVESSPSAGFAPTADRVEATMRAKDAEQADATDAATPRS